MNDQPYSMRRRRGDLAPDPEMWAALEDGTGLTEVLDDFYTIVYADPRLAPFFHGVTRQRVVQKQYSFMRAILTGERCYMGDRPRNAHHWMVISDELFDYRESLLEAALRRYGLPEHLVVRWRAIDEIFRKQIVKTAPKKRRVRGVEFPLDGYSEQIVSVASICDECQTEVPVGSRAIYHVRTGKTRCAACYSEESGENPVGVRESHVGE